MCAIRSHRQRGIDLITGRRRARDSLLFSRVRFAYQKAVHSFIHSFCPFCFRLFLHISLEISFVFFVFLGGAGAGRKATVQCPAPHSLFTKLHLKNHAGPKEMTVMYCIHLQFFSRPYLLFL